MKQLNSFIILSLVFALKASAQIKFGEKRVVFAQEQRVLIDITKDTSFRFTPTIGDIDSADLFLQNYFGALNTKDGNHPQLDNYYRQYAGLWLNGQKCIFINSSCSKPDYFLQNTFYSKGGGPCYFRVLVDINKKKVFDFYFNAPK